MFRLFGIHLPAEAAWVASAALSVVLTANSPRLGRRSSQIVSIYLLAAISCWATTGAVAVGDAARGGELRIGSLLGWAMAMTWVIAPMAIAWGTAVAARTVSPVVFALAITWITMGFALRWQGDLWSTSESVASIALLASAAVLASAHSRTKA